MTDSPDEYGELLRRALSAEANSVVPSPDGLEIIRARIERRGLRGLRGLMWWRAGISVAGAVLVASTVVMVVPEIRERVIPSVDAGKEINFTESTPPDGSATSRPPAPPSPGPSNPAPLPIVTRSGADTPAPEPTSARSATASPRPSARPTAATAKPRPTPTPPCPTTLEGEPVETEENPEWCEEAEATSTPSRPATPSPSPCSPEDCATTNEVSPPPPTEATTLAPAPTGT
ncbi:hypothetical protein ACLQ2R_11975 [Streptosporangium sp. DT93]|uniref:hypothetical protein n=1 Tax=Streptosporangium sp. DT93 TaxID=3393428 RepID=UPI003CF2AFA8